MSELLLSRIFFGNCFRLLNAMDRRVCTTGFHVILFFPRKKLHVSHVVFRRPWVYARYRWPQQQRLLCALHRAPQKAPLLAARVDKMYPYRNYSTLSSEPARHRKVFPIKYRTGMPSREQMSWSRHLMGHRRLGAIPCPLSDRWAPPGGCMHRW